MTAEKISERPKNIEEVLDALSVFQEG
jgi:hypothetical protein